MNPHESDDAHNRTTLNHSIRRCLDDIEQAIITAEEDLAYAERRLNSLREQRNVIQILRAVAMVGASTTVTPQPLYTPGYTEIDEEVG